MAGCSIVGFEEMDLAEQMAAMATTNIVIMTHGAAMANLAFLPKVS